MASYQTYPYWNNSSPAPTITVTKGDAVSIMLSSDGSQHQLLVDFDGDGPSTSGCATADRCSSLFTSSTSISFTANNAGTFYYYCTLHPTSMVGKFVVQNQLTPDFTINPSPLSLTVPQGSSGTSTITLNSLNGFSGTLNLTATVSSPGPRISFSATSVSLSSGGSASSNLTVSTSSGGYYSTPVAQGNYSINVTASSVSLSHSRPVSLTVGPASTIPPGTPSLPVLPIIAGVIAAIVAVATLVFVTRRKH